MNAGYLELFPDQPLNKTGTSEEGGRRSSVAAHPIDAARRSVMQETAQLAGFVAAHAILRVSEGESLTMPLLVVEKEDGSTQFIEVRGNSSEEAVAKAERLMDQPVSGACRAVLAFEAFLNLPPGKTDAIFLQAFSYRPKPQALHVAVPFRAANSPGGFAVFRPKFFAYEDDSVPPGALDAFRRGVALHPPGQAVWNKHVDESR
jgi:hypothetical protein